MLLNDSVLMVLCVFGALQGVLWAIAVGSVGAGLRRSNRLLALIFLGTAAMMLLILQSHRQADAVGSSGDGFWWELAEYSLWAFAGPLFLLYVSLVAALDEWPHRVFLFHFLPGAAWLGYVGVCLLALGREPRLPSAQTMILYQLAYTGLSFRLWRRTDAGSRTHGPSDVFLHSFWVPALLCVLLFQHASQLLRWFFSHEPALREIVPLVTAGSFVALTLLGSRRALRMLGRTRLRYTDSTLTPERAATLAQRLERLMERDRPYLQIDLSLDQLAVSMEIPKTHLSQVLNETLGRPFLDYVAGYRVAESLRLLTDGEATHLTIEAVARRSGFNSRSTFYDAFRRHQGLTPTEFRRRAKQD